MQLREAMKCAMVAAAASLVLCGGAMAAGGSPPPPAKPSSEITGTVYDTATGKPIEGAYAVAIYVEFRSSPGSTEPCNPMCVKTRGMYTGKDGRFRFPVERPDGNSPGMVSAIKPGFSSELLGAAAPTGWHGRKRPEPRSDSDLPLVAQNAAKPQWWYGIGEDFLIFAKTREGAEAAVEFLKIRLSEERRLGAGAQAVEVTQGKLKRLESLPPRSRSDG